MKASVKLTSILNSRNESFAATESLCVLLRLARFVYMWHVLHAHRMTLKLRLAIASLSTSIIFHAQKTTEITANLMSGDLPDEKLVRLPVYNFFIRSCGTKNNDKCEKSIREHSHVTNVDPADH